MNSRRLLSLAAALLGAAAVYAASPANPWPQVTPTNKPWTRWWWMGSAVDKPNLTRELTAIAQAGFGGVEITPIYGVKGAESRYLPFLSPAYLRMLSYATSEAHRLGLGVDMATGTGWPFGGPHVSAADAEQQVTVLNGKLQITPTHFTVKRAAPGGGGPVIDPYSSQAMADYLAPFSAALAQLPPGALRAQFHDSFEYKATWAREVLPRFKELHGYDLTDHLKEFGGEGDPDAVARVKADYRDTIADLHLAYIKTWVQWAHAHGELARNQAHGAPGNLLDLYAAADIPETELFGAQKYPIPGLRREPGDLAPDPQPSLVHRLASSAAHVAGKPLTSSETFTWLREHFHEAPSQMKPELDRLFVCGINHVFYHGTAYSPADAPWPGWIFYAATEANPRNPLWDEFGAVNEYIARCQSLLQAGQPDNDGLLYWPVDDLWHDPRGLLRRLSMHASGWLTGTPAGDVANALLAQGHTFDFVSDRQLAETRCEQGRLKTPGASYRAIVVPRTGHMSVATLQRLMALAGQGATVIFVGAPPADVPGLGELESRRAAFKAELARLAWGDADESGIRVAHLARGRALCGPSVRSLMGAAGIKPEAIPQLGLEFIRRRVGDDWVYFIANLSATPAAGWVTLARPAVSATIMDPLTRQVGTAAFRSSEAGAQVFLQLRPGESQFVVAHARSQSDAAAAWPYYQAAGASVPLNARWSVDFVRGGPALPPSRTLEPLRSWADDPAAAAFGGTARYRCEFDLPDGPAPQAWRLELGDVRETAVVSLNGRPVGNLWSLPFGVDLRGPLPRHNVLTIDVTNTAANRIRDLERRDPTWRKGIKLVNVAYKDFNASKWPVQPSGLLGPVRLVPIASSTPAHGGAGAFDWTTIPSPVIFRGDATTAYRDPAAVYHDGWFHLFFTLGKIEADGRAYSYVASSRSRDLVHWSPPVILTPRDLRLNYGSPGDVIRYHERWVLCLQTYPRPNGEKYGNESARIWTMDSTDLEHWSSPRLLRVKGDDVPVEKMGRMIDPFLFADKDEPGKWWCFYKQNGVSMSWSRDLEHWTYAGHTAAGENPCVIVDGKDYVLFHSPRNGIGVKRSTDLTTWRDEGVLKLGQAGWPWAQGRLTAGFVLDLRRTPAFGKALMFFHGSDFPEADPRGGFDNYSSIGIAWSDDLQHWHWAGEKAANASAGVTAAIAAKPGEFDVTQYGAIGDGRILDTAGVQGAIDACAAAGGGKVLFPAGRYLCGTLRLRSGVTLDVEKDAVLLGSPNLADYPPTRPATVRSFNDGRTQLNLIFGEDLTNVAITGAGTIDGQGEMWPKRPRGAGDRPFLLRFVGCRNVRVEGVTLRNSGFWMQHYLECDDVVVRNVHVFNHANWNNDAIDIDGCHRVVVDHLTSDTSDDGITLKSTTLRSNEDVTVRNCDIRSHAVGIKFGTESIGGFKHIRIEHCEVGGSTVDHADFGGRVGGKGGIAIMSLDGATVNDVDVADVHITGTLSPIFIRLQDRGREAEKGKRKPIGSIRSVTLRDITATGAGTTGSLVAGIPGHPIQGLTLRNVRISTVGGVSAAQVTTPRSELATAGGAGPGMFGTQPASGILFCHVAGVTLDHVEIDSVQPDARPALAFYDADAVTRDGISLSAKSAAPSVAFLAAFASGAATDRVGFAPR